MDFLQVRLEETKRMQSPQSPKIRDILRRPMLLSSAYQEGEAQILIQLEQN